MNVCHDGVLLKLKLSGHYPSSILDKKHTTFRRLDTDEHGDYVSAKHS
jgi:hypothetical protein